MARRPSTPKPVKPYLYDSLADCEDPDNATKGLHLAQVKIWPPQRSRSGEANPNLSTRCVRCGCHMLVYGDNDPDVSGFEVQVLEPERRQEVAAKK